MLFLAAEPDITPITTLITTWIHIGQALVGSVGALALIFALASIKPRAVHSLGHRVRFGPGDREFESCPPDHRDFAASTNLH
jgi:hypothetical protein